MNKSSLKTFAVEARRELREKIGQKLNLLGIEDKKITEPAIIGTEIEINGKRYSKKSYDALIKKYEELGYTELVEESAYTWFNRLTALAYMEANEYIEEKMVYPARAKSEPGIIDEYMEAGFYEDLSSEEQNRLHDMRDGNKLEEMYTILVEEKCHELSKIMPFMFERSGDWSELLFPAGMLMEKSFLMKLRDAVSDSKDENGLVPVELIGWLYQFYNSEKKDEVFEGLKKNKKITKENIPAATQLFTPKWVVKYMVENSLGKLAVESLGVSEELKSRWKYYITPSSDVSPSQEETSTDRLAVENIKILDPAMGSGHMLTYSFDVLYDIYIDLGWIDREAVLSILKNNIFGLEIDDRAGMLASFAIMMKAREKFRRLFRVLGRLDEEERFNLNTLAIQESNGIGEQTLNLINSEKLTGISGLIQTFRDAKEYGSILKIEDFDFQELRVQSEELREAYKSQGQINLFHNPNKLMDIDGVQPTLKVSGGVWNFDEDMELIERLIHQGSVMVSKYDVTITNPPYMSFKGYSPSLKKYVEKNFKNSKVDLFAVFIEKCGGYTKPNRYTAMITMQAWMFLSSFEKLRTNLISTKKIESMLHLGYGAIGIAFGTTAFCFRNSLPNEEKGNYFRLFDKIAQNIDTENIGKIYQEAVKNSNYIFNFDEYSNKEELNLSNLEGKQVRYQSNQKEFKRIPGSPIAYWISDGMKKVFKNQNLKKLAFSDGQILTGNNEKFLRMIWEVDTLKVERKHWLLHTKGGDAKKWAGNVDMLVLWTKKARNHYKTDKISRIPPEYIWNMKGIVWNGTSSRDTFMARFLAEEESYNKAAPAIMLKNNEDLNYILGLLNTKIVTKLLNIVNPTMYNAVLDILNLPIIKREFFFELINEIVEKSILITKNEWNSRETSWDFTTNQLTVDSEGLRVDRIEETVKSYEKRWTERFVELHKNEEELNRLFIEIYGLEEEMDKYVDFNDITLLKKEKEILNIDTPAQRFEDIEEQDKTPEGYLYNRGAKMVFDRSELVKQFISYAVGCIMGRYSIDKPGLIIANSDDELAASQGKLYVMGADGEVRHEIDNPRFIPGAHGIVPVTGENVFDNDIVKRIVEFVEAVYGTDTLEENLRFIALHLGGKKSETPRETIRRYFIKDFYKDHLQRYKKRPIYWMMHSGKKDGFSALIYMHRYEGDTIGRVRTDYLNRYQEILDNMKVNLDRDISEGELTPKDRKATEKRVKIISDQLAELRSYANEVKHLANQKIEIDLDDGIKVNYAKFAKVMKKI